MEKNADVLRVSCMCFKHSFWYAAADMPLSSTVEDLVQCVEHKVGCIKARHCLVVGKHTAQLDETLYAAGVSRDCTVQIQLT